MKRTFILLTLIAVIFTACAQTEPVSTPTPQPTPQPSAVKEIEYVVFPDDGADTERYKRLERHIKVINLKRIINADRLRLLEENGINLDVTRVEMTDFDNLLITIEITNRHGKSLTVEMPATMRYSLTFSSQYAVDDFRIRWGNINIYKDRLIVAKTKGVEFYNSTTFEKLDKTLNITEVRQDEYFHIFDVIAGDNGYIAAYFGKDSENYGKNLLTVYNKDLQPVGSLPATYMIYIDSYEKSHNVPYRIYEYYVLKWLDNDRNYVADYYYDSYNSATILGNIYDVVSIKKLSSPHRKAYENGDVTVDLIGTNYDFVTLTNYFAIRKENGKVTHFITFKQDKFPHIRDTGLFGEPVFSDDGMRLTFDNDDVGVVTTIDFNSGAVTLKPQADGLKNRWAATDVTNNGDRALITTVAWLRPINERFYLYNYTTDKTIFLEEFEPKWINASGTKEYGFLPDGNIYVCSQTECKVFDRATGKVLFDLAQVLKNREGDIAIDDIRRDPVDGTFLVLYTKGARPLGNYTVTLDHIGTQGEILNRYILPPEYFDVSITDMELEGTHIVKFVSFNHVSGEQVKADYDLQTRQFTVTYDNREETRKLWAEYHKS